MAVSTTKEIRQKLLERRPDQWVTYLEILSGRLDELGFEDLESFVTAPVGKGGLKMTMGQVHDLCYFNPSYKHKADKLMEKLSYKEKVAPRNAEIKKRYSFGETQQEIADKVGLSREGVRNVLAQKHDRTQKSANPPKRVRIELRPGTESNSAAEKIIEKFGSEYAEGLSKAIEIKLLLINP